jgi:hypothetical protein
MEDKNKVIFIIAQKYFRGYESYVEYYINNIQKYYDESLTIVVDNNSLHKEDIFQKLRNRENVVLLDNNIDCKFEIGAYTVGLNYLIEKNLLNKYDYLVFTQDTFILNKRLDFNDLFEKSITACPINSYFQDGFADHISHQILNKLGLLNNLDKITFCWCNSFIVSASKCKKLFDYLKQIKMTTRTESCASERYLARILYELNNFKNNDIDGDIRYLGKHWDNKINSNPKYDCQTVNPYDKNINSYFIKRTQHKTERTKDIL